MARVVTGVVNELPFVTITCVFVFCCRFINIQKSCCVPTSCPSANHVVAQEPCGYVRTGGCLACVGGAGWGQERTKEQKTSLQRKRKKQSKQLSYIINPPPRWIWAPTWLPYNTRDPRLCQECGRGSERVCVCVCMCVFGVVLCPAAAGQNICWMQSGQVRERERETRQKFIRVMLVPFRTCE